MHLLLRALVATSLVFAACETPQEREMVVERSYEQLLLSPTFPKDRTPADIEAIESIRRYPEMIAPLLVADLSQGPESLAHYPKTLAVFHSLPDSSLKLQIAREVVGGFQVGERTPLIQFLAFNAATEDMPRLIAEIEADPNGQGVSIAIAIAQSKNDIAISKLRAYQDSVPGVWGQYLKSTKAATSQDTTDKQNSQRNAKQH